MIRKTPISDSDKTFYDGECCLFASIFLLNSALLVASKMADAVSDKGKTSFIINPVVGVCLMLLTNKVRNIWTGLFFSQNKSLDLLE